MPVIECDVAVARAALAAAGATIEPGNTEHELWRAQLGDATAVAYEGKVLVQGRRPGDVEAVLRRELGERSGDAGGRAGAAECYFDGASRGNPGPAAIGWVIADEAGIVAEGSERIGRATNNQAEYEALIRVLEAARTSGFEAVEVRGDSELVVNQVTGAWDANDPELRERRVRVLELLESFEEWTVQHVPREANARADELASEALEDA